MRYRSFVADSARWDGFEFRAGDIVISTPPKCGTTWMQNLCALLIFQRPDFGRLAEISPWLDMQTRSAADVFAALDAQTHRRFIKSHTPFDGLPHDERVTYISVGREPREVALSWAHHIDNLHEDNFVNARGAAVGFDDLAELPPFEDVQFETPLDRFWHWVDDPTPPVDRLESLRGTLYHVDTFWQHRERPNVVLFHYRDMLDDLPGEMRRLADALDISVDDALLAELAAAGSFGAMKANADQLAPDVTNAIWKDNTQFFDQGPGRDWRTLAPEDEMPRYEARVAELCDPKLAAWMHR